jgi:hypothetical protein
MSPMVQASVDVSLDSGSDSARGLGISARERPRRDPLDDNRRLAAENARLLEENDALREAAALWIRLYEKQLERANHATSQNAQTARSRD